MNQRTVPCHAPDIDLCRSKYNDLHELLNEIDSFIMRLEKGDSLIVKELSCFFAPTGSLQEISISNGWVEKFIELSMVFDKYHHD
jgi:hypothetical protein